MLVDSIKHQFQIEPEENGIRLDHFLVQKFPDLSRSRLQSLIKSGHATVEGKSVKTGEMLKTGWRVDVEIPAAVPLAETSAEAIPLDVLFEDEHLLVLNKPAGIVVHPGAGNEGGTLVNALLHHCSNLSGIGGVERPGIVHRLDKETSGCLVVAKDDVSHRHLAAQFADRLTKKTYLAIVEGAPRLRVGRINAAIGRHHLHRQKMAVSERDDAREATTDYRVLVTADGLSLIECKPLTGRTHQIRVHLKHLGFPLCGDPVYGRKGNFPRHLLHAWKLEFTHPIHQQPVAFTAPVPADFPLVPPV